MTKTTKLILISVLIVISLFGLYKWWLHDVREKSCRDYATAWLEIDDKHPRQGLEEVTGYNNIDKYKKMYEECMFLQGY